MDGRLSPDADLNTMVAARGAPPGPPRPDSGAMLAARAPPPGPPRPDLGAMLAARGAGPGPPRPDLGAMLSARGAGPGPPRPGLGAMFMARGTPNSNPTLGGGAANFGGLPAKKKPAVPQALGDGIPSDSEGRALTPTSRLRVIDALRMHVPIPQERERLKLSGGDRDRLAIGPDHKVLLLFCGASRGVRFTSAELRLLSERSAASEAAFAKVDAAFKSLSAKAKKTALPPEEVTVPLKALDSSSLTEKRLAGASSGGTTTGSAKSANQDLLLLGGESTLDLGSYSAPSAAEVLAASASSEAAALPNGSRRGEGPAAAADAQLEEVRAFHKSADAFMKAYRSLVVDLVKKKQAEIKGGRKQKKKEEEKRGENEHSSGAAACGENTGEKGKSKEDEEDEGGEEEEEDEEVVMDKDHGEGLKNAKPLPEYLSVLLTKYKTEVPSAASSRSGSLCDTIGGLAVFLACSCLFHTVPLTGAEFDALETLVLASSDGSGRGPETLPCFINEPLFGSYPPPATALATPSPPEAATPPPPAPEAEPASQVQPAGDSSASPPPSAPATPLTSAARHEVSSPVSAGSRKYWARRLWVFLCKVRELKSVPKGEKILDDPKHYHLSE